MIRAFVLALGLTLAAAPALAVTAAEMLDDPALEARARAISKELRCLVCQNQAIDDSNAEVARDLRRLVRERLVMGESDAAIIAYVHDRYGDFVLLKPPVKPETYLLWAAPALALVIAVGVAATALRRRAAAAAGPLSEDEEARLKRLLEDDPG